MPMAASSSSACTIANVALPSGPTRNRFMYSMAASGNDDDGVIGYQLTTVTPANMQPSAAAELPSFVVIGAFAVLAYFVVAASASEPCRTRMIGSRQSALRDT